MELIGALLASLNRENANKAYFNRFRTHMRCMGGLFLVVDRAQEGMSGELPQYENRIDDDNSRDIINWILRVFLFTIQKRLEEDKIKDLNR
jgi:hypothetical protein